MTNSWSLLYDEIYGDEPMTEDKIDITTGAGNTASTVTTDYKVDLDSFENMSINTGSAGVYPAREDVPPDLWGVPIPDNVKITTGNTGVTNVPQSVNTEDTIHISTKTDKDTYIFESPDGGKTVTRRSMYSDPHDKEVITGDYFGDSYPYVDTLNIDTSGYPSAFTALSDNDDAIAHLIDKPISSGIEDTSTRKYKEDESIEALKNYISTTYGGHYTSDNNSVQTLDLIESVGDAESFCRSNAIKYLSRYDKKGQAKRDILKALHYSLLLYHFSGQLNETTTRGYETF